MIAADHLFHRGQRRDGIATARADDCVGLWQGEDEARVVIPAADVLIEEGCLDASLLAVANRQHEVDGLIAAVDAKDQGGFCSEQTRQFRRSARNPLLLLAIGRYVT